MSCFQTDAKEIIMKCLWKVLYNKLLYKKLKRKTYVGIVKMAQKINEEKAMVAWSRPLTFI